MRIHWPSIFVGFITCPVLSLLFIFIVFFLYKIISDYLDNKKREKFKQYFVDDYYFKGEDVVLLYRNKKEVGVFPINSVPFFAESSGRKNTPCGDAFRMKFYFEENGEAKVSEAFWISLFLGSSIKNGEIFKYDISASCELEREDRIKKQAAVD